MKYLIYIMIGLGSEEQVSKTVDLNYFESFAFIIAWPISVGRIIADIALNSGFS